MSETKLQRPDWRDDDLAAKRIKDQGADYHRASLQISQIDLEASKANLGRLGRKIDDDRVLRYAIAMQDGACFPVIVVVKLPSGKYLILGGVHRVIAVIEGEFPCQEVEAYIVDSDDARVRDFLMVLLNADNGLNEPQTLMIEHARRLHETHKVSLESVAADFYMKESVLAKYVRDKKVQARLDGAGLRSDLPKETIFALHSVKNESRFLLLGRLFTDFEITGGAAAAFVREVRDLDEAVAEAKVAAYRERLVAEIKAKEAAAAKAPRAVSAVAVRNRIFRQMDVLAASLAVETAAACQITSTEHLEEANVRFRTIFDRAVALGLFRLSPATSKASDQPGPSPAGGNGVAVGAEGMAAATGAAAPRGRRTTHVR